MSKLLKTVLVLVLLAAGIGVLALLTPRPAIHPTEASVPANAAPAAQRAPEPARPAAPATKLEGGSSSAQRAANGASGDDPRARVRLRLVDERTREPLPFVEVVLHERVEVLERMESDAQGLLQSKGEYPPGEYALDFDSERHEGDLIQTRMKEARELRPEIAFTLALGDEKAPAPDFPTPAGPSFTIQSSWPRNLSPASFTALLSGADPRLAFDRLFAPLHDGKPVWTRFSPLARFMGGGPPYLLRVTSEDGLWYASATIDKLEVRARPPIELVFEPRARLVGRVLAPDGRPFGNEQIQAWPPGASFESTTNRPLLLTTRDDGSFDLRAAVPGHYTLKLEGKGFLSFSEEIELPALTRIQHDLHLVRPDPSQLMSIRGHVTSTSGTYEGRVLVLLTPEISQRGSTSAFLEWSGEPGAKTGSFEFKLLMPGNYTVDLRPPDLVGVEPRKLAVHPSDELHEFVVQDKGARAELHVSVLGAEDDAPLKAWRLSASVQGSSEQTTLVPKSDESEVVLRAAPIGSTLELRVTMQGRQTLWTNYVVPEKPEPLVLKLKQGWGAELTVMGPKLEPLEGAKVFLDEELAGVADAKGTVRATRTLVPQKCRVEYRDWKMAPGGEVSPETGQFRAWQAWIQVRMEPSK